MSSIGAVEVRVSPEAFASQAEEVRKLGNDMKVRFQALKDTIAKTKHYWIGEAGEQHRRLYDEQSDEIDMMLRRILEHPDDLLAISENYKAGEKANVDRVATLDADIIL